MQSSCLQFTSPTVGCRSSYEMDGQIVAAMAGGLITVDAGDGLVHYTRAGSPLFPWPICGYHAHGDPDPRVQAITPHKGVIYSQCAACVLMATWENM